MADLSRLLTSHWLCKLASFDIYFTGNRISDYASSAPAVVEEEHRPPPSLSLTGWYVYIGCINRESCATRSHTRSFSICPTQLTTSYFPTPHTFPQQAPNALTCGFPHSSRNMLHTQADTCVPAARLFDYPTQTLRSLYCGATCAEQRLRIPLY